MRGEVCLPATHSYSTPKTGYDNTVDLDLFIKADFGNLVGSLTFSPAKRPDDLASNLTHLQRDPTSEPYENLVQQHHKSPPGLRSTTSKMQTKVFVETTRGGTKQLVRLQRAHSHHHSHHHHHHDLLPPLSDLRPCHRHTHCLHVPHDEWNDLVRAERALRKKVEKLTCENKLLACKVKDLRGENESLKCSLDGAMERAEKGAREMARMRREIERLQRDNDCLTVRVRELLKGCRGSVRESVAEELRRVARGWQDKFECAQEVIDEKAGVIEKQRNTIATYGRLLNRHGILEC